MPTDPALARRSAPGRVYWLSGPDAGGLRHGHRDIIVSSKADWLRAAFGESVRDRVSGRRPSRLPRVLSTVRLRPEERAAYETVSDVVVDRGIARMLQASALREALEAKNRADLIVAASYSADAGVVTLYRGTLEPLLVPAGWFRSVGEATGARPDFDALTPTDYGQTLALGEVEVAADALLYEFDAEYRRRAKARLQTDDGLGASVRRLRAQRGLRQEDLARAAALSRREIGRIERGETEEPLPETIERLAGALGTTSDELHSY